MLADFPPQPKCGAQTSFSAPSSLSPYHLDEGEHLLDESVQNGRVASGEAGHLESAQCILQVEGGAGQVKFVPDRRVTDRGEGEGKGWVALRGRSGRGASLRVWRGGPNQILATRPRVGLPGARGETGRDPCARHWRGGPVERSGGGKGCPLTANLVLKGSCGHATSSMRGRVLGEGRGVKKGGSERFRWEAVGVSQHASHSFILTPSAVRSSTL